MRSSLLKIPGVSMCLSIRLAKLKYDSKGSEPLCALNGSKLCVLLSGIHNKISCLRVGICKMCLSFVIHDGLRSI